jgi:hypothetical protein
MAMLIGAALAFCAPVWSDAHISGNSSEERMCYCDCDAAPGSKMCMHMCELAKYENRDWATSCHRPEQAKPAQRSSQPGPHSSKDNGVQQARR